MRKIICDGCGEALTDRPHAIFDASVTIRTGEPTKNVEVYRHFDLCSDCRDKFKRGFPDKWERVGAAVA